MDKPKDRTKSQEMAETLQRFGTVCLTFGRAQHEANIAIQKRMFEAWRKHMLAIDNLHAEARKQCQTAYEAYADAWERAGGQPDSEEIQKAYQKYLDQMQQVHEKVATGIEEGCRDYDANLQEIRKRAQELAIDAHRNYLRSLKEVWTQIDVDVVVDAQAIASVSTKHLP